MTEWTLESLMNLWGKVFKNGPSKIWGRQPLPYHFKLFKGCLPQILLGPFLNTLSHLCLYFESVKNIIRLFNVSLRIIQNKGICTTFSNRRRSLSEKFNLVRRVFRRFLTRPHRIKTKQIAWERGSSSLDKSKTVKCQSRSHVKFLPSEIWIYCFSESNKILLNWSFCSMSFGVI